MAAKRWSSAVDEVGSASALPARPVTAVAQAVAASTAGRMPTAKPDSVRARPVWSAMTVTETGAQAPPATRPQHEAGTDVWIRGHGWSRQVHSTAARAEP